MIRYPPDVAAEIQEATHRFFDQGIKDLEDMEQREIAVLLNAYVYEHCSDRAKGFLKRVLDVSAYAEKHGLKV